MFGAEFFFFMKGTNSASVCYGSLFLALTSAYCEAPSMTTWNVNNVAPIFRHVTAVAIGYIMTNSQMASGFSLDPSKVVEFNKNIHLFSVVMVLFNALNPSYLWWQNQKQRNSLGSRDNEPKDRERKVHCSCAISNDVFYE